MTDKQSVPKKGLSADWLVRGALSKIGDTVDRFTGRRWTPSSSIATSELIERVKKLLDVEAKEIPGKGTVVPHNIKLRMQWDKFSTDAEGALESLENEMLVAVVDHINDSLYYTYAPVKLDVKPDYFIEGVKLMASFEHFTEDDRDVEMNVTVPSMNLSELINAEPEPPEPEAATCIASFKLNDADKEVTLKFPSGRSCSVGRSGGNDLILDHSSVSKMHASLAIDHEGSLTVADTGSTNGTFINDERIAYGKAIAFTPDDKVRFGTIDVSFGEVFVPEPVVEMLDATPEDESTGETVEIGGFEFKGRAGREVPDAGEDEDENLTVASSAAGSPDREPESDQTEANITVAAIKEDAPNANEPDTDTDTETKPSV